MRCLRKRCWQIYIDERAFRIIRADIRKILMRGKEVKITSPTKANQLGIGMVHQHFMLVDAFTVTENIVLGSEPSRAGMLDHKKHEKRSKSF